MESIVLLSKLKSNKWKHVNVELEMDESATGVLQFRNEEYE